MTIVDIEMVHDLVCSWCPIGFNHLSEALENLEVSANWRFLPYELNPSMALDGEDIDQHLKASYGWSAKQLQDYRKNLLDRAEAAGVEMNFSKRKRYFNTHLAHRLMVVAEKENRHLHARAYLVQAYFKHGRNLSQEDVVLGAANHIGLTKNDLATAMASNSITQSLNMKIDRAKELAISSTPTFIFNGTKIQAGSHSVEYFEKYIRILLS